MKKDLVDPIVFLWNHKLSIGGIQLTLGSLLVALLLLLFSTRLSRLVTRMIDRRIIARFVSDQGSQATYHTLTFYVLLLICVSTSLGVAGIPLTVFTVFGGAIAIGVGFGSQNLMNNFISGIILFLEKPVRVGDVVELDAATGTIQSIGPRSTKIRNGEGKVFIIPNSFFIERAVLNSTFSGSKIKQQINFGVDYSSDVRVVEKLVLEIVKNQEGVLKSDEPFIIFDDFAPSALNFQVHFWTDIRYKLSGPRIKSEIRFKMNDVFKANKISMPFPQQDVHFNQARPLEVVIKE